MGDLQIPGQAVKGDGSDLADPTLTLLRDLELLPQAGADQSTIGVVSGTPYSLQVITSGALAFNKWWSSIVALAGGGGAIWAGIQAYFIKQNTPVQVALVLPQLCWERSRCWLWRLSCGQTSTRAPKPRTPSMRQELRSPPSFSS